MNFVQQSSSQKQILKYTLKPSCRLQIYHFVGEKKKKRVMHKCKKCKSKRKYTVKVHEEGSSTLLLFIFWGALPKIEKNVKICLNTFSRNYLCQKIVKGGWQSWIFRDPLNSTKFGCFTKITCRSPIVKVRYKCYTFSETSGQPLKGGEEIKVKNGQKKLMLCPCKLMELPL